MKGGAVDIPRPWCFLVIPRHVPMWSARVVRGRVIHRVEGRVQVRDSLHALADRLTRRPIALGPGLAERNGLVIGGGA